MKPLAGRDAPKAAFDAIASRYDEMWTNSVIGRFQRRQVMLELNRIFTPGDEILDLGCGTGEDATRLACSGVDIHAIDASAEMLRLAREKAERAGVGGRVSFELRPLEDLAQLGRRGPYDGALSNFGAINCVPDLRSFSASLAPLLRPGAPLVLCFIGRFCMWEAAWHLLHGRPAKAFRRLRRSSRASLSSSGTPANDLSHAGLTVHYPSRASLAAAFGGDFALQMFRSIGILVPPSYMEAWGVRHPGLLGRAARVDCRMGGWPLLRALGDHRLAIFKRRGADSHPSPKREAKLRVRCPACHADAGFLDSTGFPCAACGFVFENNNGILRAIPTQRLPCYERFRKEYSAVRLAEGRGSENGEYYRALPYKDLTGRKSGEWAIRARTYRHFERCVLPALELCRPLDILDLGAGTGWLSYRLAKRGHKPVAVDLLTDTLDGLGAAHHFWPDLPEPFPCIEAEFDNLPFCSSQFDLALFNASLHYSIDYRKTLEEVWRCLRPSGSIVILDSPVYRRREHGERMAEERHREFERRFGFRSDSVPSREFLYDEQIDALAGALGLRWEVHRPWYGVRWFLRPWKARLKGARPPSRFNILVGRRLQ